MTKDEALAFDLALAALECKDGWGSSARLQKERAIAAIKQARSAPTVQKPVATLFGSLPVYDTSPPAAPVPTSWMEMVTANLVREGVNKHKARELAEHFYSLKEKNT